MKKSLCNAFLASKTQKKYATVENATVALNRIPVLSGLLLFDFWADDRQSVINTWESLAVQVYCSGLLTQNASRQSLAGRSEVFELVITQEIAPVTYYELKLKY